MTEINKQQTDEALIARAQKGETQATEELILRYGGLVRKLSRRYFLVGGETEDLIQEGMMGLFQATTDYKGGSSFKTFAYTCINRRMIDAVKAARAKKNEPLNFRVEAEEDLVFGGIDPEEAIILFDEWREMTERMSRVLSDFEFKIFTMYMDGMTCAQICAATGKTVKSVDNAIQRSKRKLQTLVSK